jgi:thiol-disulfide isomerase/thioredoxin
VQAVYPDGVRLTFVPQECKQGESLVGASDLLGKCQVDLKVVDQIILGEMIKSAAKELTYGAWKLSDAVEPQFTHEAAGGAGGGTPKVESSLVSKPAPDFHLDLLDGKKFKLSEQKGHIVVLDFWASWCGPCMQAMPQVDAVLKEFDEKGVKLVAVNMQEDRAAITGALERLKISPTVALDIDGAVAERYQVSAIPQTVVIDAEGNVAELFIGANSDFAAQLRARIQGLLSPNEKPQPPDAESQKP